MGTFFVVATPIGNLGDISLRALETLKSVGLILAEDTRVTSKLLAVHGIAVPMKVWHQHSGPEAAEPALELLRAGGEVALVSDAGTPGINDPGGRLVALVSRELPEVRIVPIPGPNAAVTALSVSGFPADRYSYRGFVPHKKGRRTFFAEVAESGETVVFYESKYRIAKALGELSAVFSAVGTPDRPVLVARELTKKFETLYRGTVTQVAASVGTDAPGEFVVVVGPKNWK